MSLKNGSTLILKKKSKVFESLKKIYNKIFPFFGCIEEILEVFKDCFFNKALWAKMNIISLFIRAITIAKYKRKSLKKISFSNADRTVFLKLILLYFFELYLIPKLITTRLSLTPESEFRQIERIIFIFRIVLMASTFFMAENDIKSGLLILVLFCSFLFFEPSSSLDPIHLYFKKVLGSLSLEDPKKNPMVIYNASFAYHKQFISLYLILFFTLIGYINLFRSTNQYETKSEYELNNQDLLKYELMEFIIGVVILGYSLIRTDCPLHKKGASNSTVYPASLEGRVERDRDKDYSRCQINGDSEAEAPPLVFDEKKSLNTPQQAPGSPGNNENWPSLIVAFFCILFSIIELAKTDMLFISKKEGTNVEGVGFRSFAFIVVIAMHFSLQRYISRTFSEINKLYGSYVVINSQYRKVTSKLMVQHIDYVYPAGTGMARADLKVLMDIFERVSKEVKISLFLIRCSNLTLCYILASSIWKNTK